jgi:hypothetical protein
LTIAVRLLKSVPETAPFVVGDDPDEGRLMS